MRNAWIDRRKVDSERKKNLEWRQRNRRKRRLHRIITVTFFLNDGFFLAFSLFTVGFQFNEFPSSHDFLLFTFHSNSFVTLVRFKRTSFPVFFWFVCDTSHKMCDLPTFSSLWMMWLYPLEIQRLELVELNWMWPWNVMVCAVHTELGNGRNFRKLM